MNIAIGTVFACVAIYVVIDLIRSFVTSTGTAWQRALIAGQNSATILWQRLVLATSAFAGALAWFADVLGAPSVAQAMQGILKPQYVPIYIAVIAVIGEAARRRTL